MLKENQIEYRYREYTKEPLDSSEITALLAALGVKAQEVLRKRDPAFRQLGLTGQETEQELIAHMSEHPTLLQRPIGVVGVLGSDARAVVGRPPESLLQLVGHPQS